MTNIEPFHCHFSHRASSEPVQTDNRLEAPFRRKAETEGAMHAVPSHYTPQRFGRKHYPSAVQTTSHHLPYPPLVMGKAGLAR